MKHRNYRMFKSMLGLVAAIVLGMYVLAIAKTVLWKYIDEKGIAHYVDELYKVPDKYKAKAVKVEIDGTEQQPSAPNASPPPPPPKVDQANEAKKAEWVAKAMKAVEDVKRLEEQVKAAQPECDAAFHKWQLMPTVENRQALDQCTQRLEQLKADLEKAKEYKKSGIYQEAQSAGVPVEWIDQILQQ